MFECKKCGKILTELTEEIIKKAYEGYETCLSCRGEIKNEITQNQGDGTAFER
jgi:hypothetical protein